MKPQNIILKSVGIFTPVLTFLCLAAGARYIFVPRHCLCYRATICFVAAFAVFIFGYAIYFILKNSMNVKDKRNEKK